MSEDNDRPASQIIYVLSDNRSGSTLLDQLLGGHEEVVSLGEVHHLAAYAQQDRRLYDPVHPLDCSCGKALTDCQFWQCVESNLASPLASLNLHSRFHRPGSGRISSRLSRWPRRILHRYPSILNSRIGSSVYDIRRVAADSFALFDAVADVTGVRFVTDSSKSAIRYRALYNYAPGRVFAIVLVRDYRGVVHSKVKRGRDVQVTTREWARRLALIEAVTRDVPSECVHTMRYEDLCEDPRREMSQLCDRLGLSFSDSLLARPQSSLHHLGGSPSKFDPSRREIALDRSYVNAFSTEQLAEMRRVVGELAVRWGYD